MAKILRPRLKNSVVPRMISLSPYELYLEQIRGVSDNFRATAQGLTYVPAQFGGLKGQRESIAAQVAVQMVDFENNE